MNRSASHHIMKIYFPVAALALAALACETALAQIDVFSARVASKELKLANPTDQDWADWFLTDNGFQRMIERNMPFIEVENTGTDPIKEFHLTIGDERFNFGLGSKGTFATLGRTTPGIPITSTTEDSGDELIVNIGGGGLLPGELFRFKVNIDIDPSFAAQYQALFGDSQPDFRTVLFDMNGTNVYDGTQEVSSADNAEAWVVLDPEVGPDVTTDPVAFADAPVAAAAFFNDSIRGSCCCESDPVLIFEVDGEVIPEPTSACLLLVTAAFGLLATRRSTRFGLAS
jgi:hypothetical protein